MYYHLITTSIVQVLSRTALTFQKRIVNQPLLDLSLVTRQRNDRLYSTGTGLLIALRNVDLIPMILGDSTSTANDTPSRPALS